MRKPLSPFAEELRKLIIVRNGLRRDGKNTPAIDAEIRDLKAAIGFPGTWERMKENTAMDRNPQGK